MLRGLFRLLFVISALFFAHSASADAKSKQQFQTQLQPYINQAQNVANSKNGVVMANMPSWGPPFPQSPPDPVWYEGNILGVWALAQDFWVNFFHDFPNGFLDCFDFDTGSTCKSSWGIPWGLKVSYRWPLQFVHSKRFFQNRYLPPFLYQAFKSSGYYENIFYPATASGHAPLAMINASVQTAIQLNTKSWAAYVPAHGFIVPKVSFGTASIPLDQPQERGRYDGGKIGEDLNQLEYMLSPTLAHTAWYVLVQYFPFLKILPCAPPKKMPAPFTSEQPGLIEMTRNAMTGFLWAKDKTLQKDLTQWLINPAVCQEWMMSKQRQNIPHDLYDFTGNVLTNPLGAAIDLASDIAQGGGINGDGAILTPLAGSQLAKFDRMCTKRWGGSIPFTTVNQVHDSGFIDAGKNFEKAIRLGTTLYQNLIKGTSAAQYVQYYPLNKKKDAYQLTYHDEWECNEVGTPGKLFSGANAINKEAEHGLYSMTHWYRVQECCLSFSKIIDLIGDLAAL